MEFEQYKTDRELITKEVHNYRRKMKGKYNHVKTDKVEQK